VPLAVPDAAGSFLPSSHNKRCYYIRHIQSQLLSQNAAKRPPSSFSHLVQCGEARPAPCYPCALLRPPNTQQRLCGTASNACSTTASSPPTISISIDACFRHVTLAPQNFHLPQLLAPCFNASKRGFGGRNQLGRPQENLNVAILP
jgi:hypothetical protein